MNRAEYETWLTDRYLVEHKEDALENALISHLVDTGRLKVYTEITTTWEPDAVIVEMAGDPVTLRICIDKLLEG